MIVYFYHLHTCTYRVWTLSSAICHTTPAAATMLKCTSTRKSTVAWVADCYINQTLIDGRNYYYHSNINLFLPALQLDRPVPLYKEDTEDFTHVYCRSCTIVIGNHNKPPLHLSSHDCIERIERLLFSFYPRTLLRRIPTAFISTRPHLLNNIRCFPFFTAIRWPQSINNTSSERGRSQ